MSEGRNILNEEETDIVLKEITALREELNEHYVEMNNKLDGVIQRLDKLGDQIVQLRSEIGGVRSGFSSLIDRLDRLDTRLARIEDKVNQLPLQGTEH